MIIWRHVILASRACPVALSAENGGVDYAREIKPVLKARCYACHGALKQKGGLRVDTVHSLLSGTKEDELLQRIASTDLDERMPPEGEALKPEEIAAIRAW